MQAHLLFSLLSLIHIASTLPPFIIKQHDAVEVLFQVASESKHQAKPFTLHCEAGGDPPPRYKWYKDNQFFNLTEYENRVTMSTENGTLTFNDPVIEDEGSYQCFAKNKHGLATFPRQTVKKTFLDGFKDDSVHVIEVQEGFPLKIECSPPNGYPKPNVFWLIQTATGELYPIEDARKTFDHDGNLWFSHVNADDALKNAYYTCAAAFAIRNEYKLGKRVQLTVTQANKDSHHLKASPIMQYVSSPHVVALRGHRTELFCIYSGSPAVEVNWKINGTAINYDKRVVRKNFGKSLLIRDTRLDDRGTYTCDVSNGAKGNQSSLISVEVLAAPYFTVKPLSMSASENKTVELLCEARGKPVPEVMWTHNGRVVNSNPGDRISALKDKLMIKDLMKSDAGNYGCNATNELGFAYHDVYLDVEKSHKIHDNTDSPMN